MQLYAYCGFPKSLNGIGAFMIVVNERKEKGIVDKQGKEIKPDNDIDEFLKVHLFADIFGSYVLSYRQRELVTIAALASMPGAESQLGAHIGMGSLKLYK